MDDRDDLRIPALPTERELRRARLIRHIARKRLMFTALHLALGVASWAALAALVWGAVTLVD